MYVNDIVIIESDSKGISSLKSFLQSQFPTKDLGILTFFLGIEVMRSKHGIFLFQRKYVFDLLSKAGKLGVKSCSSPMVLGVHLTKEGETFEDTERYRRLVGKLNYLTVTCLDITHSVSVVISTPMVDHWPVVKQILCYLRGAPERGILYSNHGHNKIECFSDID